MLACLAVIGFAMLYIFLLIRDPDALSSRENGSLSCGCGFFLFKFCCGGW